MKSYLSRDNDAAIKVYQDMTKDYPYETEAYQLLAQAFMAEERFKEAIQPLRRITSVEPDNSIIWSMLGEVYRVLKQFDDAAAALRRYGELAPGNANGPESLGDVYRSQGAFDLASEQYNRALAIDPSFHLATLNLALVDSLKGNRDAGERKLMKLQSDTRAPTRYRIDAVFDLATLYLSEGRFQEAAFTLESSEALVAKEKIRSAHAYSMRGIAFLESGNLVEARKLIERAVESTQGIKTRYLFARGLLELKEKNYESVNRTIAQILQYKLQPENPDRTEEKAAAYFQGMVNLDRGDTTAAIGSLSRSVALSGFEYGIYRLALARAYLMAGAPRRALEEAARASAPIDPAEPRLLSQEYARLESELDRTRAILVKAQALVAIGQIAQATEEAQRFLQIWAGADSDSPEVATARSILKKMQK